ncbi:MAG: M24 family metallopeptidase [Desulfobacteraceae bacterium]|nr:MAG: M24 family metallopeptidase [Desulfobacteraceae bacterium]
MFSPKTHIERRDQLKKELKTGVILLLGNDPSPVNYPANAYPFRQDSTFLYYIGIDQPELAVILDLDQDREILFGNEAGLDDIIWTGSKPLLQDQARVVGLHEIIPLDRLPEYLSDLSALKRPILYLPPYRPENTLKIHKLLNIPAPMIPQAASVALIQAVVKQRNIKSDEELAELDKAVTLTGRMHLEAMRIAKPGLRESDIAAALHHIALANGPGFSFMITTTHGEILHNTDYSHVLQEGELLLVDAGTECYSHYSGDITRTFPVGRKYLPKQKEIYEIVLNAHQTVVAGLKPGVRYLDLHLLAAHTIAEGLKALNIMQGNIEEAVRQGAHALFFPHGLGHMLGLDVHDMEDLGEDFVGYNDELRRNTQFGLKSLRLARELEPGFAITVEPGIYFIPELIKKWKAEKLFKNFINYEKAEAYLDVRGIRIEDNYAVTPTGSRLLGKPVPKQIAEIEALRG